MKRKKVGLALSGGAALGFAHIGVIKVLLQNNIPIDVISGTSMGALVGGVFASGMSIEDMENVLQNFSRKNFVDINPFILTDGLLHGKKVTDLLRKLVGDKKIEDCNKKYCAIVKVDASTKYGNSLMREFGCYYVPNLVLLDYKKKTMKRVAPNCMLNYECIKDAMDEFAKQ